MGFKTYHHLVSSPELKAHGEHIVRYSSWRVCVSACVQLANQSQILYEASIGSRNQCIYE